MPMTIQGLQEIGLRDWPRWYRHLNPGYFADQTTRDRIQGRGKPVKGTAGERNVEIKCAKARCGSTLCQGTKSSSLGVRIGKDKVAESLRDLGNDLDKLAVVVDDREKGSGQSEELGDHILKRLRGLENGKRPIAAAKKEACSNTAIERAATKDARKWEDDESEDDGVNEKDAGGSKGKLVDV